MISSLSASFSFFLRGGPARTRWPPPSLPAPPLMTVVGRILSSRRAHMQDLAGGGMGQGAAELAEWAGPAKAEISWLPQGEGTRLQLGFQLFGGQLERAGEAVNLKVLNHMVWVLLVG